jgi:hypothetical protein
LLVSSLSVSWSWIATSFYYFAFGRGKKLGGVSRWFLQGVLRILMCFLVVNRGEAVVDCVVDRGELCGVFRGRKNVPLFQILFLMH